MEKVRFPSNYKVYIPIAILFVILVFLMPRSGKFNYDYRKGSPWMYGTLVAEFDFPLLKTDAQIREEREMAGSTVIPYYRYSDNIVSERLESVADVDFGAYEVLKPRIISIFSDIYEKGVLAELADIEGQTDTGNSEGIIFVQKDKRATEVPLSEVYNVATAKAKLLSGLNMSRQGNMDSLCYNSGIYDLLIPNLIYDKQTTDMVHRESVNDISPVSGVVNAGQMIVSDGEMITAEIEQILDSYKAEFENNFGYSGPRILLWIGNILLAFGLVAVLFLSIYYTNYRIFSLWNKYLYLLIIFLIASMAAFFVEKTDPKFLYLTPFVLIALYLQAFFKKRVVLPVYILSLLPLLIFTHNGTELFVMYLVAGVVAMFVFVYFNKGWQQFVTALCVFVALFVTWVSFRLINGETDGFDDYRIVLFMFLGSLLLVAGYPLIYLFEKIFMLVSSSRLIELSDTNNKLLRELAHKAPGTFQHCLQVMNMADAAARAIDADVPLVRAGALYHDVGKTMNPQCFIENEAAGTKYHDGLSPRESAQEIIRHVPDGLALADKYNLPEIVKEFITTHHGTTSTAYFYNKYINDGGDPANADDFYYKGQKPHSPEQVILMLCDTLEAASRTLKDYTPQSISSLVEGVVKSKMAAGQFEDADITLKDLNVIKNVMKDFIQQVHHARVVYPKRKVPAKS